VGITTAGVAHNPERRSQMILESGKVIITKDEITVTHFHFDGVDMPSGQVEALEWAMEQLRCAKEEALSFMKG
jgi:hypothetical protein